MSTKNIYRLIFFVGANPIEEWFPRRNLAFERAMEWNTTYRDEPHTSFTIEPVTAQLSSKGVCEQLNALIDRHCLNEH